jgi:hypothetical protein
MRTDEATDEHPGLAWDELPDSCHACLIFDDPAQRDATVRDYLGAGLGRGELVRYFTDVTPPDVVESWVSVEGGVTWARDNGPLRIMSAEAVYCPEGQFDPRRMIAAMIPAYERARTAGFTGVRSAGEMTWALRGIPGSDRLLEYEALLNTVDYPFPHMGMCQYDARQFDGATLFRVLRVHPYVVAGNHVVWNPYYAGREAVLAELGLGS